jgi:osmotically inducible protein OsmC
MARQAEAEWKGDLKGGSGRVKLGSGAYEGNYSFTSRFENGSGAQVHLGKDDTGFLINLIELTVTADVPKVDEATFQEHVAKTNTGCIIKRSLAAVPSITVKATLKK